MSRPALLVAVCLVLVVAVPLAAPSARAQEEVAVPTTVQAAPGTVSGAVGQLLSSDDLKVTLTEADTTPGSSGNAWLKPNADNPSFRFATQHGCPTGFQYQCLYETPPNDGNTTYATSAGNGAQSAYYQIEDWGTRPYPVVISSVAIFTWARKNQSTDPQLGLDLVQVGGSTCLGFVASATQAFANYSYIQTPNDCSGTAWTTTSVNATQAIVTKSAAGNTGPLTATSVGLVVAYAQHAYALDGYLNFTQLVGGGSGWDYRLEWEGTSSLPDASILQVDRDGTWTTIASPFLTSGPDGTGSYAVLPEESDTGAVNFRILDADQRDTTAGAVALDVFRIVATRQNLPGDSNPLKVYCEYRWPAMEVACAADELLTASGITVRAWTVDGLVVKSTSNATDPDGRRLTWTAPEAFFVPAAWSHNVTYSVWVGLDRVDSRASWVGYDATWLWIVYFLVVMLVLVGVALRYRPPRRKSEPPRKEESP